MKEKIKELTIEEKASLTSGQDMWHTKEIKHAGIPAIWLSDGPHGLRKQEGVGDNLGINASKPSVSFPSESTTACSFDRELLYRIGEELGDECNAEHVHVLLGPGVNIKRSPLCGRNFEYFSEDPYLAGELGAAYVQGLQSKGVSACVKHFLLNSQETRRMISSSEVDERTVREIYLPAFKTVVKKAQPWAVMASYNKINGTYATENRKYLVDILRGEWGFDGCVVSDWGATHDRARAVAGGCDLTMPGEPRTDGEVASAIRGGMLAESLVDSAAEHVLGLVERCQTAKKGGEIDFVRAHALVREAAAESAVLLKNNGILPLEKGQKIAFIGKFAKSPRYQGGGSSHVNTEHAVSAWEAVQGVADVVYAQGYDSIHPDETLIEEAVALAKKSDVAVIFAGLPEDFEVEGNDRTHLRLPESHNALISAVAAVQKHTVVVLSNGSAIELPWADEVGAILETYLGGEASGESTVDLLFGRVNPSGRLAESFPYRLEDNPSYLYYFGSGNKVEYREGVYVGYRYYESCKRDVRYPFGYGLSYTTFSCSDLELSANELSEGGTVTASVSVTNTGSRAGKEVVQLYVGIREGNILRPVRELRGFEKIMLQPGETKRVTFTLDARAFSYWNDEVHAFCLDEGEMEVQICKNAHEVVLSAPVKVHGTYVRREIGFMSTVGELAATRLGKVFLEKYMDDLYEGVMATGIAKTMAVEVTRENFPQIAKGLYTQTIQTLSSFLPKIDRGTWETIFQMINIDEEK